MNPDVEKQLRLAEEIIARNKNADVAMLLKNLPADNTGASQAKQKAYLLSVILWPLGLYYFCKYLFIEDDAKTAWICLIITVAEGIVLYILGDKLLGSFGNITLPTTPSTVQGLPSTNSL